MSALVKWTHQVEIPEGHLDLLEAKGCVEVEWSRGNVVNGGKLDGVDHGHEGNERVIETNTQRQVRGPGGPENDQEAVRAVEPD